MVTDIYQEVELVLCLIKRGLPIRLIDFDRFHFVAALLDLLYRGLDTLQLPLVSGIGDPVRQIYHVDVNLVLCIIV